MAVDSSGYVYVTDSQNHRIQKFSSTGTFVTAWGTPGSGNGQFNGPHGVAVDSSGYVYVADTGNHRIQVQIGYADVLLWQHQPTGSLSAWLMNGTSLTSLATVNPGIVSDTNWKIVGVADFNNDGHPDILWQHQTTGSLSAWLMNGTSLETLAVVTPNVVSDTNWKIAGIADFNNDGHPDILWQHQTTGSLSAWLMNGTSLETLAVVTPSIVSDTNWKIAGIADFNNDGHPDILWQHQPTGMLSAWLMNGTSLETLAVVTPGIVSDTNWKIVGVQ